MSFSLMMACSSSEGGSQVVERDLTHAVPLNSSPSQVLDLLNWRKIEHSPYMRKTTKGNLIFAMIRQTTPTWSLVKTGYSVVFRFDDRDRLLAYDVRPVHTGP
jgi:hypothetical protein